MRIQAVLLVIVFVFDLFVWSLMANLLFSKGASDVGWYTLPALLFGLATAIVVFAWERSISVFDTRDRTGRWRRWGGFSLRIVLISLAAYATARPFELIVFRSPINERLYAESVRRQLVLQHLTIGELRDDMAELDERRRSIDKEAQQVLRGADAQIRAAVAALQRELYGVNQRIERLSGDIATAQEEGQRVVEAARWRGEREGLESRRQALLAQIADLEARMSETIITERRRILERLDAEKKAKDDEIRKLQADLSRIRSRGDREQGAARARASVAPADASVFRQLRIIDDLRAGTPPRWPEGNEAVIAQVRERYAVEDVAEPETRAYQLIYWVALTVGMVIPLMALLFKLVMSSSDLATYYSLDAQWDAGNPDALQHTTARRRADARQVEAA
jgi:hypothetical protein